VKIENFETQRFNEGILSFSASFTFIERFTNLHFPRGQGFSTFGARNLFKNKVGCNL
jgi:hypothetical protein